MLPWLTNPRVLPSQEGRDKLGLCSYLALLAKLKEDDDPVTLRADIFFLGQLLGRQYPQGEKSVPFHQLWINNSFLTKGSELQPLIYVESGIWKLSL
jgi:hypothetical protein